MNFFQVFLKPDGSIRFCYKVMEPLDPSLGKRPFVVGLQGDSSKGEYLKVTDSESLTGYEITFHDAAAVEDPDPVIDPDPLPDPPPVPEDSSCPPCDPCPVCGPCPPCPDPDPCPPCEPEIKIVEKIVEVPVEIIVEKVIEKTTKVPVDRPVWGPWYWIKILWNKVF